LIGLWWEDLELSDMKRATIRFWHQVDRQGRRVELKTDESKAVLPLPRSAAVMLLAHRASTGPRAYVFATKTGRPLGQRNVLRALHRAQERARTADGAPTFRELFVHEEDGKLVVDQQGWYACGARSARTFRRWPTSTLYVTRRRSTARTHRKPAICCGTRTRT
jgi:hypothetical protein